jgi:FixJ family two-component response regulator
MNRSGNPLQGLIRSLGFAVQVFASAEEFMSSEQLRATTCLILDIRMPGMLAPEVQRWLAHYHEIPILFITACGDDEAAHGPQGRQCRLFIKAFECGSYWMQPARL